MKQGIIFQKFQTAAFSTLSGCKAPKLRVARMATKVYAGAQASPLLTPVKMGDQQLCHRIAMAPMTRLRSTPGVETASEQNALYYEQRASKGGLLVTECFYVTREGRGYVRAPGLASEEQAASWRAVTDRVHAKGGVIFVQVYHAGRVTHRDLIGGMLPVSPSAVGLPGQLYVEGGVKAAYEVPRELTLEEVKSLPKTFAEAAKRAVELGGFDGVEVHCGNGYLLHSFLAKKTNLRTDEYGGSIANRSRLLLEVLDAVVAAVGPQRTALKLQPGITFSDIIEPEEDVKEALDYLGPELSKRNLAFVDLASLNGEPYCKLAGLSGPNLSFDVFRYFSERFKGTLCINGGITIEQGEQYVSEGVADIISYGNFFIANANLPALVAAGVKTAGLNHEGAHPKNWYGKNPADDAKGYTDWPLREGDAPPVAAVAQVAAH